MITTLGAEFIRSSVQIPFVSYTNYDQDQFYVYIFYPIHMFDYGLHSPLQAFSQYGMMIQQKKHVHSTEDPYLRVYLDHNSCIISVLEEAM